MDYFDDRIRALAAVISLNMLVFGPVEAQSLVSMANTAEMIAAVNEVSLRQDETRLSNCKQPATVTAKGRAAISSARSNIALIRDSVAKLRSGDERALFALPEVVEALTKDQEGVRASIALCK